MYIDLETGTILNGPIALILPEHEASFTDNLSDSEVIELAEDIGVRMLA